MVTNGRDIALFAFDACLPKTQFEFLASALFIMIAALRKRYYRKFQIITKVKSPSDYIIMNTHYVCPICNLGFQQEPRLWANGKCLHQEAFEISESLGRQASLKRLLAPGILLQPVTRLISHEQLFAEVKVYMRVYS